MSDVLAHAETGTATATTTLTQIQSIILTAGADAAEINVREVNGSGAIRFNVKAALGTTVQIPLGGGVRPVQGSGITPSSVWHVQVVAGTTPRWTLVGV